MSELKSLLLDAATRGAAYLDHCDQRPVAPAAEALTALDGLRGPLPSLGLDAQSVIEELDRLGSPASMASAGSRYYGFVIGGSVPAALAGNMLASAWDQCAGMCAGAPGAAVIEEIACKWLLELLGLPAQCAVGLTTGATMANFASLAAARHRLLDREGWSVEEQGLYGAPEIQVIVGDEVHVSALKALGLLGLGSARVTRVAVDDQGRMRPECLPELGPMSLLCTQAGNVNSGAFDPVGEICDIAQAQGAWVHVDGAFGLWARSSKAHAELTRGVEKADSWAADAHKWLNVPYDCGVAIVRDHEALAKAMAFHAAYLVHSENREPSQFVPELSRRARGVDVYAALRQLGRQGVEEIIQRNCRQARRFAESLGLAGYEVFNDVVLNQVLVSFGSDELTWQVIEGVQQEGTCWAGGTTWQGRAAMRISVSSWRTSDEDVEKSIEAICRVAKAVSET